MITSLNALVILCQTHLSRKDSSNYSLDLDRKGEHSIRAGEEAPISS